MGSRMIHSQHFKEPRGRADVADQLSNMRAAHSHTADGDRRNLNQLQLAAMLSQCFHRAAAAGSEIEVAADADRARVKAFDDVLLDESFGREPCERVVKSRDKSQFNAGLFDQL